MPRKRLKQANPAIPALTQLETSTRNYVINNRNTLQGTERVLRQNPEIRRELDSVGGLNGVLTRSGSQSLERDYLTRFSNVQTSLFVDRVTQGDLLRTPSLETMFEQSRNNNKILTSIASAVDSCCSEIINRLTDLNNLILERSRSLRNLLISNFADISTELDSLNQTVVDTIQAAKEAVLEDFTTRINRVIELITQSDAFIREKIESSANDLKSFVRSLFLSLENEIDIKVSEVLTKLTSSFEELKIFLSDSLEALTFNINSALREQTVELSALFEAFYTTEILPVISGIASGVAEIVAATTFISATVEKILVQIETLPKTLEDLLTQKFEEFKDYLNEWKKSLILDIAQQVSLEIVGESYYRWDSVSSYYPTLTFLFKEVDAEQYPKRSQVKIRYNKSNEDITQSDIKELRIKCEQLAGQSYTYGRQRYNFVSKDKRFKTTIFGQDSSQIKRLFTNLLAVINEPFDDRDLSITFNRNRISSTKRTKSLDGIGLNKVNYQINFPVQLYKVVLFVNNLESPLILYKK